MKLLKSGKKPLAKRRRKMIVHAELDEYKKKAKEMKNSQKKKTKKNTLSKNDKSKVILKDITDTIKEIGDRR